MSISFDTTTAKKSSCGTILSTTTPVSVCVSRFLFYQLSLLAVCKKKEPIPRHVLQPRVLLFVSNLVFNFGILPKSHFGPPNLLTTKPRVVVERLYLLWGPLTTLMCFFPGCSLSCCSGDVTTKKCLVSPKPTK